MQTLDELRRRIDNADDMQSVVSSMKVLAVVSIRQFEKALVSLNDYNRVVELGLQAIIQNGSAMSGAVLKTDVPLVRPPDPESAGRRQNSKGAEGRNHVPADRTCVLIFGSEQGLSGQFNEQVVEFALRGMERLGLATDNRSLLAVGDHVAYRLKSAGLPIERIFPIHGTAKAVTETVREVFLFLDGLRREKNVTRIILFYHKPLSGAHYLPQMSHLYPVERRFLIDLAQRPWPSPRSRPVIATDQVKLFRLLIRQYLRITMERAFVESLLSENASRLLAMQVAEKNIAEYIEDLKHQFNNRRQGEITAELLDIVAGSEALAQDYL